MTLPARAAPGRHARPPHIRAPHHRARRGGLAATLALAVTCVCGPALAAQPRTGLEQVIRLGRADRWRDLQLLDGVVAVPGRWGDHDLVLDDRQRGEPTPPLDLQLSFDLIGTDGTAAAGAPPAPAVSALVAGHPPLDAALLGLRGPYQLSQRDAPPGAQLPTARRFVRGGASGAFAGTGGLVLRPQPGALFAPGTLWDDFTLEMWLYPVRLADGETVLRWDGARWQAQRRVPQRLVVSIEDRRLRWELDGLFRAPPAFGAPPPLQLTGLSPLLPQRWRHHALRFDSRIGLLEYTVDGVPEAIVHVTDTGGERGSVFLPHIGNARRAPLEVAPSFVGFVDELRITGGLLERPQLSRYGGSRGLALTRVFDLGHAAAQVLAIEAEVDRRDGAEVFFYYRTSERASEQPFDPLQPLPASGPLPGDQWVQFVPGDPFAFPVATRYIQMLFELLPSGGDTASPRVQEVRLVYAPAVPPAPPTRVAASAGDGSITVRWDPVTDANLAGYLVYYGTQNGIYVGQDSDLGPSPIRLAGTPSAPAVTLTGLRNGVVYTVAVTAVDTSEPAQQSEFSAPAQARPARIFGRSDSGNR